MTSLEKKYIFKWLFVYDFVFPLLVFGVVYTFVLQEPPVPSNRDLIFDAGNWKCSATIPNREDDGMGQDGLNAPQVFWTFFWTTPFQMNQSCGSVIGRTVPYCLSPYTLYIIPLYLISKKTSQSHLLS